MNCRRAGPLRIWFFMSNCNYLDLTNAPSVYVHIFQLPFIVTTLFSVFGSPPNAKMFYKGLFE